MNNNIYESVAELVCLAGVFVSGVLFGKIAGGVIIERRARNDEREDQEDIND